MGMIGILVAASPIFAGFLMAGYSIFHDDPYFDTVDKMMISLGSLITGDEVLGTLRIADCIFDSFSCFMNVVVMSLITTFLII